MQVKNLNSTETDTLEFINFEKFDEIKEIGSGGYGTVYTAKCKIDKYPIIKQKNVALKCFKQSGQGPELVIAEVSKYCYNHR